MENNIAFDAITNSEEETQKVAFDFAKELKAGDVVALYGDLGAGKTVFAKGIARGLGIKTKITSPTFIFQKTYKGTLLLHHLDLYRAKSIKELQGLALDEIFSDGVLVVVEWPDRLGEKLPSNRWDVEITKQSENARRIKIQKHN